MYTAPPNDGDERHGSTRRTGVTLSALAAISIALFVLGPRWAEIQPLESAALSSGAGLADGIMGRGTTGSVQSPGGGPLPSTSRAPLAITVIALALLTNPTDDDETWARALACLLLALTWWGLWWVVAGPWAPLRAPAPWLILAALLATDTFRRAAGGAGVEAVAMGVGTAAILALDRLRCGPDTTWRLGVVWGLATLVHPAGLALGVPIFAMAAVAYTHARTDPPRSGEAPLPPVPLSLLLSPLVALATIFALWPELWGAPAGPLETLGRHLGSPGGAVGEPVTGAVHLLDHALAAGSSPGAAVWEALRTLSWPIFLAAAAGLAIPGEDRGRAAAGMLLGTLLLAGSLHDGGGLAALLAPLGAILATRAALAVASRRSLDGSRASGHG